MHAAANLLVARHPALRTRFPAVDGVPVRHVSAADDVQVAVEVGAATPEDLQERVRAIASVPFDLATDLPFRVHLFQLSDGGSAVLLVVHHIVSDAASIAVLIDELARAYDAFAAGASAPADLADEVPAVVEPQSRPEDVQFWAEHLRGFDPDASALPWGRPGPSRPTFSGSTLRSGLDPDVVEALGTLRRTLGVTENIVLLSAFYLTLFRHGAGPDLVVGVPVAARGAATGASVGFAVSTLPLRVVVDPRAGFTDLVRQVRDTFLAGLEHASVSTEEVLGALGHHSPDWRAPLFRYLFNYRPWDEGGAIIGGEHPEFLDPVRDDSRLDLQLIALGAREHPALFANYSTEVHDEADVAALVARMQRLLREAALQPHRQVRELDVATAQERVALQRVNATGRPDLLGRTVLAAVREAAGAHPDTAAVVEAGASTSYADLLRRAGVVAGALHAAGVRAGDVVALALPRGAAFVTTVLALWENGASYLPVDPAQPSGRLQPQLSDAKVRLVVVDDEPAPARFGAAAQVVRWDRLCEGGGGTGHGVAPPPMPGPRPEDVAYVMFTSGSTGRPRGVLVTHANLANLVGDFADRLAVTAGDAVLWSTTTTFDISGLEVYLPLTTGATVVVAGSEAQIRPHELLAQVQESDVRVVQATPTFWRTALPVLTGQELRGRTVLCGGEPLARDLAEALLATGCRLLNVYGPTETTIWSTAAEIAAPVPDPVPVGLPLANTTVAVRDEYGAELPPGVLGELWIGGAGVADGYLDRAELTRERFVELPGAGRCYRTGDLARRRRDGGVELFGRNDRQVKLRGHRLELPEIETVLSASAEVTHAAVVVVGDPQADGQLRAFVCAAPGTDPDGLPERLWQHLAGHLPAYALPSRILVLDRLPLSQNGKTDYVALRELPDAPGLPATTGPGAGGPGPAAPHHLDPDPDPELTERLVALWGNTLGRAGLGPDDHFFLNGGHSLLAARLAARVRELTGDDVPVRAVFDHPTARTLSAYLATRPTTTTHRTAPR